jgi:hypothetical protein
MLLAERARERLAVNLASVRERMERAAGRVGRDPASIQLVLVTKDRSLEEARLAYELGIRDFGENRPEEALPKIRSLGAPDVRWHMIGRIQSRKARLVGPNYAMVHSVDRPKIARKLDERSRAAGLRLPVLLECNVTGEPTKAGWRLADRRAWPGIVEPFAAIVQLSNLEVRGLMTIAPAGQDEATARQAFRRLAELRRFLEDRLPGHWMELSMGMTDDFETAIEEGATIVRIGRAVFEGAG